MQRSLNEIERSILTGAAADLERYAVMPWPATRDSAGLRARWSIECAKDGLVVLDAAGWLKCSTSGAPGLRMAISRAYLSLQKRGLVTRIAAGYSDSRCTHLRLTDAGMTLAEQLRQEQASSAEVAGDG